MLTVTFIINELVSPTQAYAIPCKDISDTSMSIRDTIHFINKDCQDGILLNLDLNKAFDRVDHTFLKETLKQIGFGPNF